MSGCGCTYVKDGYVGEEKIRIVYCLLHESAAEMLVQLKRLFPLVEYSNDNHFRGIHFGELIERASGSGKEKQ